MPFSDFAGNTLTTARELTITSTWQTVTDSVGAFDSEDYYRFTLNNRSSLNLTVDRLSADADVQLLNSSGAILTTSNHPNTLPEEIAVPLEPGIYYIRVFPYSGNTDYDLNVLATPTTDYAGSTTLTAREIFVSPTMNTFRDWVGSTDITDLYHFTLSGPSNFSLNLNGLSADADVQLLNSTGAVIASSVLVGTQAEAIATVLDSGNYYIHVLPYSGNTYYNLNVTATPLIPTPTANWTVLVYMSASNMESFVLQDFLEMAAVGSTSNVNVVVQLDRTAGYDDRFGDWTDTRRGLVFQGSTPNLAWGSSIGEANMGDPETLSTFLNWGMTTYQANNYALVLLGHGNGVETTQDELTNDSLTGQELSTVLAGLPANVSLVGANSCLMGMAEFAYQIREQAAVFVASQEVVPGYGFNYNAVLYDLALNPMMTATQLGQQFVQRYGQFYESDTNYDPISTMSAINLTGMNLLSGAISNFATTFMTSSTSSDRDRLEAYRMNAGIFGDLPTYRDLGSILTNVASDIFMSLDVRMAAQAVLGIYDSVVLSNYSEIPDRGTGLSINFQARGTAIDPTYSNGYLAFTGDTAWDEFLNWWAMV